MVYVDVCAWGCALRLAVARRLPKGCLGVVRQFILRSFQIIILFALVQYVTIEVINCRVRYVSNLRIRCCQGLFAMTVALAASYQFNSGFPDRLNLALALYGCSLINEHGSNYV